MYVDADESLSTILVKLTKSFKILNAANIYLGYPWLNVVSVTDLRFPQLNDIASVMSLGSLTIVWVQLVYVSSTCSYTATRLNRERLNLFNKSWL